MPLEGATYVADLVATNPLQTEGLNTADDHLRLIKATLLASFPEIDAAITATVEKLNNGAVPTGTICGWYSTSGSIPTGWTLCNGVQVAKMDGSGNITPPDMRDKFIVMAGTTYSQGTTGGSTTSDSQGAHTHTAATGAGGDHTHGGTTGSTTLTTNQIPAHTHTTTFETKANVSQSGSGEYVCATAEIGTDTTQYTSAANTTTGSGHTHTISASGTHTHTISSDGAHTHTVTPPYFALVFMMRK